MFSVAGISSGTPRLFAGGQPVFADDSVAESEGETSVAEADVASVDPAEIVGGLTEEERRILAQLQARDQKVRAHEQAHRAVGGRYAGAISYSYTKGPDGQRYAVSGEVPIDVSPVRGDPEATIDKMEIVIAAALAPTEPSPQDRAVAAAARSALMGAEAELRAERAAARREQLQDDSAPGRSAEAAGATYAAASRVYRLTDNIEASFAPRGEAGGAFGAEASNELNYIYNSYFVMARGFAGEGVRSGATLTLVT